MTLGTTFVNKKVIKHFKILNDKQLLAHAYMFIGPAGIGKLQTALAIARNLIGNNGPADIVNHADVHMIKSESGETIKIEQVRNLLEQIKLKPFSAQKKVFIIKDSDQLTQEAGNALLKTLEEPASDSLLILTTAIAEKNLDTILSRCQSIYFTMESQEHLRRRLEEDEGFNSNDAHYCSYISEGSLGQAIQLKENNAFKQKNMIIDQFILSYHSDEFVKNISGDKERMKELLAVLLSWVRDCMLISTGICDERLVHRDRFDELKKFQKQYSFDQLRSLHDEIINTYGSLADNLNIKVPLLLIKERLWVR